MGENGNGHAYLPWPSRCLDTGFRCGDIEESRPGPGLYFAQGLSYHRYSRVAPQRSWGPGPHAEGAHIPAKQKVIAGASLPAYSSRADHFRSSVPRKIDRSGGGS